MGERPQFSVIIPAHNRLHLLKRAVASVGNQTFRDYELIIVDDGSIDGTWDYLSSLGPTIKALRQENRGPGAARNLGVQHASGIYLSFLDSDDLWFPWTLDVYAMVLVKTNYPAFVAGKPRRFASEEALSDVEGGSPQWLQFEDYLDSGDEWRWWGVSSFVIQRETFLNVGGFSEELQNGEDIDLALHLGTARGFVQLAAPDTFAYREHGGNVARDVRRNVSALQREVTAEHCGKYPGGRERSRQRRQILSRHIRPLALECAKKNMSREAWWFYCSTLSWHVALGRWRFISAFPLIALLASARSKRDP